MLNHVPIRRHSQMYSLDLLSVVLKQATIDHVTFAHVRGKARLLVGYVSIKHIFLDLTLGPTSLIKCRTDLTDVVTNLIECATDLIE